MRSWREQIESDHRFLIRAVPFALTFVCVMLDVHIHLDVSWSIACAAGLAAGLLAVLVTIRWSAGGIVTFVTLFRLLMLVLRDRFS